MACGWLYRADSLVGAHPDAVAVAIRVAAIAATLLATHYGAQGVRLVLLGQRTWREYVADAVPNVGAEASLVPIGVVLVLLYDPDQRLGFVLLSITYLIIDFMFARLSRTREQLRERVRDLEVLNASARRLSAALQLEELVEAIARETCQAVPEAEVVALVHRRAGETDLVLDGFDRTSEKFFRRPLAEGEGAAGWVMKQGAARRIDDLPGSDVGAQAGAAGIKSWLGVPLLMYGACEGVIAVQSSHAAAFRAHDQRLLESLAHQIAAALQNANLYELAMVDGLTGLFVRRYFDARIEEEIERSKRYDQPFSVVMMDVDDFKKLNDTHGHLVGDRVLRGIATVVKAQMRGVDTAARYGGEEIAVVLPRTEMVGAYNLAERIRAAIADLRDHDGRRPAEGAAGHRVARDRRVSGEQGGGRRRIWCGARTARCTARRRPARTAWSCSGATTRPRCASRRSTRSAQGRTTEEAAAKVSAPPGRAAAPKGGAEGPMTDRKAAERRVGWARLWARAKQIVTTDPTGSDDDDPRRRRGGGARARGAGRQAQGWAREGRAAGRVPRRARRAPARARCSAGCGTARRR